MENIQHLIEGQLPLSLSWISDLVEFDGPIISLFSSGAGKKYLYCWSDCDEHYNRWMIFEINESDLARLVANRLSLKEVTERAIRDFVFIADMNSAGVVERFTMLSGSIPDSYMPEDDSYLDLEEAELKGDSLSLIFDKIWDVGYIYRISRTITQAYNFILGASTGAISKVKNRPWKTGGFGSMHFFNDIEDVVDQSRTATTNMLVAQSPATMKLGVDAEIAEALYDIVKHYRGSKKNIDSSFNELSNRITELGLNQKTNVEAIHGFDEDDELPALVDACVEMLGRGGMLPVSLEHRSKFETAKIYMALHSRIKTIDREISIGNLSIAQWEASFQSAPPNSRKNSQNLEAA